MVTRCRSKVGNKDEIGSKVGRIVESPLKTSQLYPIRVS